MLFKSCLSVYFHACIAYSQCVQNDHSYFLTRQIKLKVRKIYKLE